MQKFYYIKTYGCQMNVHESEKLAGMLKSLNYEETNNMENADVIVFNTCCIRDAAEQKVLGNIGATKKLKKLNPNLIIAVCGCMAQEDGRKDLIKEKYPYVSIVFGTHNLHKFKDYLIEYNQKKQKIYNIWEKEEEINENVEMYRTSNNNAWVNIMYGCNNFCTYCIVPYVRGRERSRAMDDIVNEVKGLIKDGYKYITLLGQNVNSYGNDFKDGTNFAKLLKTLASLEGDFRIKFMTSHPKDLTEEVINTIATEKKISKVIHLPVQSGSNKILKLMNRNYTVEHYKYLINLIKQRVPNFFISTDIIVGFPNETEEDFNETYNLVKEVNYGGVFAFMYSPLFSSTISPCPSINLILLYFLLDILPTMFERFFVNLGVISSFILLYAFSRAVFAIFIELASFRISSFSSKLPSSCSSNFAFSSDFLIILL